MFGIICCGLALIYRPKDLKNNYFKIIDLLQIVENIKIEYIETRILSGRCVYLINIGEKVDNFNKMRWETLLCTSPHCFVASSASRPTPIFIRMAPLRYVILHVNKPVLPVKSLASSGAAKKYCIDCQCCQLQLKRLKTILINKRHLVVTGEN